MLFGVFQTCLDKGPSGSGVSPRVSRVPEQRAAGVPSRWRRPWVSGQPALGVFGSFPWRSSGKGQLCVKRAQCDNRSLTPRSSAGEVCLGMADSEDVAFLKTGSAASAVCPSFASPSHPPREEPRALRSGTRGGALPARVPARPRGPPPGRLNDSSEIFE